jgi:hypothetical protein
MQTVLPVNQERPPAVMEGTGAVAMPRRAKNIDMKNPPWNKKYVCICEPLLIFI